MGNGLFGDFQKIRQFFVGLGFNSAGQALGQKLNDREIIGVVRDYHHQSLKTTIPPVMFTAGRNFNYYSVRLKAGDLTSAVSEIQLAYVQLFPGSPYDYFFLDEFFDRQYKADLSFNSLFGLFSTLGIVVACLGLFGLSSYMTARRTKEIGIRKVMGASMSGMVLLLAPLLITLLLALVTVSFQTIKAALVNPVKCLRYE